MQRVDPRWLKYTVTFTSLSIILSQTHIHTLFNLFGGNPEHYSGVGML